MSGTFFTHASVECHRFAPGYEKLGADLGAEFLLASFGMVRGVDERHRCIKIGTFDFKDLQYQTILTALMDAKGIFLNRKTQHRNVRLSASCPLYPRKRTLAPHKPLSALGQHWVLTK